MRGYILLCCKVLFNCVAVVVLSVAGSWLLELLVVGTLSIRCWYSCVLFVCVSGRKRNSKLGGSCGFNVSWMLASDCNHQAKG